MTDSTIFRSGTRKAPDGFVPPRPIVLAPSGSARPTVRAAPAAVRPEAERIAPPVTAAPIAPRAVEPAVADAPTTPDPVAPAHSELRPDPHPEPTSSLRKRIAFLIAVIAVPAMAAPGNFGEEPGPAPTEAQLLAALATKPAMPFERSGQSFPGSAFFYVDDSTEEGLVNLPAADPLAFGGEFGHDIGSLIDAGPAASAFLVAGSTISKSRAQQCLAEAIWYEAGSESEAGQRAVAQVVLNRVAHPRWPSSVCGVVYEGSQRDTGCQFSFTCDGSLARRPSGASWQRARDIAADALAGKTFTPVGLATHYHTRWVSPYWAGSLKHIGTIGAHHFYRDRGKAGEKSAFVGTYSGIEPNVSTNGSRRIPAAQPDRARDTALPSFPRITPPRATPRAPAPAPLAQPAPRPSVSAASPPTQETGSPLADPKLSGSGQVKDQYSNAGQWKKRPGTSDTPTQSD
jgi:hypothetical protein